MQRAIRRKSIAIDNYQLATDYEKVRPLKAEPNFLYRKFSYFGAIAQLHSSYPFKHSYNNFSFVFSGRW